MDAARIIDWSSAVVRPDRTLKVGLTGDRDKRWNEVFKAVAKRLTREAQTPPWGDLALAAQGKVDRIVVKKLDLEVEDHVERVRDQLTAIVMQTNTTVAAERERDRPAERETSPREGAAQASTEAFRRLGGDGDQSASSAETAE